MVIKPHRIAAGVATVAGLMIILELIDRYTRPVLRITKSLTPTEMEELIVLKYKAFSSKYALGLKWVANPGYEEGREAVHDMLVEYLKGSLSGTENAEEEARRRASEMISEASRAAPERRMELLNMASTVIAYPPSLLFIGPPGVGKSESAYEAAKDIARDFDLEFIDFTGAEDLAKISNEPWRYFVYVDLRLTSMEPADITGIPRTRFAKKPTSDYTPFAWARALEISPGLLNLEELTNVQRKDLISAAYQLVLDHRAGFVKFNKGVMVIALGNPPEWSQVATKIPLPLLNRFETFNVVAPLADEWVRYMNRRFGDEWYKPIGDYIRASEVGGTSALLPPKPPAKVGISQEEQIPTPRSWTRLAVQLYQIFRDVENPIEYITDIIRDIVKRYEGSCTKVQSLTPSSPEYNERIKHMKMVCETFAANIGVDATREAIISIGGVEYRPDEHLKSFEAFRKWYEDTVNKLVSYGFPEDRARNITNFWTIKGTASYLDRLYKEGKRDELLRLARVLAEVADFLYERGVSKTDLVMMFSPVCGRQDLEFKNILYENSRVVREHVEEYMKTMLGSSE